jgi:trypsin-like peptidase
MEEMKMQSNPASVVRVGDGRGFIIVHRVKLRRPRNLEKRISLRPFVEHRLVVTAAHCLPKMPPTTPAAHSYERTYAGLLGTLDGHTTDVSAECLFADPVADIAILGCPDEQEFSAELYESLIEEAPALRLGTVRNGRGWLLALSGDRWIATTLQVSFGPKGAFLSTGPTVSGMSGSPILNDAGRAVGLVAIGHETISEGVRRNENAGPQPILTRNLPGWLLRP